MNKTVEIKSCFLFVFIALSCLNLLIFSPANAQSSELDKHHQFTTKLVEGQKWLPGKNIIEQSYSRVSSLNDYVFDSELKALSKGKLSDNGGKFYYKKTNRLRIEVKSKGRNNGAVVVKKDDGTIRGAGGGILKFIKMNLEPNSRMLILPNGLNVVQSDYKSLIANLRGKLNSGHVATVTAGSVSLYNWSGPVKVVDVKKGNILTDRIFVSAATNVPVEWNIYSNGRLVSIAYFKNFKSNIGLNDNLFNI